MLSYSCSVFLVPSATRRRRNRVRRAGQGGRHVVEGLRCLPTIRRPWRRRLRTRIHVRTAAAEATTCPTRAPIGTHCCAIGWAWTFQRATSTRRTWQRFDKGDLFNPCDAHVRCVPVGDPLPEGYDLVTPCFDDRRPGRGGVDPTGVVVPVHRDRSGGRGGITGRRAS